MIDLNILNIFLDIAKTGNLNLTAKRLSVTPSAVSQRLRILESQVGRSLFMRMHSGMKLSEHGHKLLEISKDVDKRLYQINQWASSERAFIGGEFVVSSVSTLITYTFPVFLKYFLKKYPDVTISFRQNISARIEEDVIKGFADIGIIVSSCKKPSLNTQKFLLNNEIVAIVSPDHPLAKQKNITKKDLEKTRLIWHAERESRTIRKMCQILGISYHRNFSTIHVPSMEACVNYVREGVGLGFMAKHAILDELKSGKLVIVSNFGLKTPMNLISRNEPFESKGIKALKTELIKFAQLQDEKIAKAAN